MPNLFLLGGGAGVLAAVLEFLYSAPEPIWALDSSRLVVLGVSCSLLGLCGLAYGGLLQLIGGTSRARLPWWGKVLGVVAAIVVAACRYEPLDAGLLGAVLGAGLSWAWWRNSDRVCAVVLACAALLYVLNPLFIGHAMDRMFSGREIFMIFLAVLIIVPLLVRALLSVTLEPPSRIGWRALLKAALAVVAAALLTLCSSVFLVRLWGFNTMAYLEVSVLAVKIGCLLIALTAFAGLTPGWRRLSRREANLVAVLTGLILFVASAYVGMRRAPATKALLARLPDTSLVANVVAGWLDRDRDGYSAAFGFGDCNDRNPDINPGAIDWPGDGVDENCFGGDLRSTDHAYFALPIDVQPPAHATASARRKVVVFVILDTLRADAVDYAGEPGSLTPEIARIAAQSLRFDRAYAQSNNTLESIPFLLQLGFRDFPRYHLPWTLPTLFKQGGVTSAAIFQSERVFWLGELEEALMGFDAKLYPDEHVRYRSNAATAALAVDQLRQHRGPDPFFLWVHFEALHDSFTQLMEGNRLLTQGVNVSELARLWKVDSMVEAMKDRYRTALHDLDTALGVLWEGIRQAEADTDVLFILTSDHGEEFYEHGGFFHLGTLHEELVRVPLILYRTGGVPRREALPVGLYRLPGTVLHWLDYQGDYVEKMDLLRQPPLAYEVFGYFAFDEDWQRRNFMVVEDGYKLLYDMARGRTEFYDLTSDPGERHDLAGDPRVAAIERRLVEKMDTTLFYMNYGDVHLANYFQSKRLH